MTLKKTTRGRKVADEAAAEYVIPAACAADDDAVIAHALGILRHRLRGPGRALNNPADVRDYLTLSGADDYRESFCALWLTSQHALIRDEVLSSGTIDTATVYPREVVRAALAAGAAAVIFAHNHPSGNSTPSVADINMTRQLKQALDLVGVRVLDHMIITRNEVVSMAERGEV